MTKPQGIGGTNFEAFIERGITTQKAVDEAIKRTKVPGSGRKTLDSTGEQTMLITVRLTQSQYITWTGIGEKKGDGAAWLRNQLDQLANHQ